MKKLITTCLVVALMFVLAPVATAMITVDPDAYSVGTLLNNAYPGVTLTALGPATGGDTRVLAYSSAYASTGTLVFGDPGESSNPTTWGDGNWDYLRADFAPGATMVSLDFIANDSSDANPVLQAYDSLNNVVDTATVGGVYTAGQIVTLTVSGSNIAYIYALGDPTIPIPTAGGSDSWTLDNLQIQFIPAPGAILLGGIGVSLVGWLRGRRTL